MKTPLLAPLIILAAVDFAMAQAPQNAPQPAAKGQPPQSKDTLPLPKELPGAVQPNLPLPQVVPGPYVHIPYPPRLPGPQIGKRNVWELYSVDSRGRFQPRVVMDPRGYYYYADGRPFPWPTFSNTYMPYVTD